MSTPTGNVQTCQCDPDEACYDAMGSETYTVKLLAPIRKEWFGLAQDLEYLTLGADGQNYGAY